jgi:hypothetical protein
MTEQSDLTGTAKRNLRYFITTAAFRDREAALHCLDVLEQHIIEQDDLIAVLRSALAAEAQLAKATGDHHDRADD